MGSNLKDNKVLVLNSRNSNSLPLKLVWTFGHNNKIPACNISNGERRCVFYVAGPMGLSYDWINRNQLLFQGHVNDIQCATTSPDSKWVATFDSGPNNALIVWDSDTRAPLQVLNEFCPYGLSYMKFSPDCAFLFILSRVRQNDTQKLFKWNWMKGLEVPVLIHSFHRSIGYQNYIGIHSVDQNHFLTNSFKKVVFFQTSNKEVCVYSPSFREEKFEKPIGNISQSVYDFNSPVVLSATTLGKFLVWGDKTTIGVRGASSMFVNPEDRIPIRLIQPHAEESMILVLSTTNKWIVSGNSHGQVHFYDIDLKVVKSYRDFHQGPITDISFTYEPDLKTENSALQEEKIERNETFKAKDFVISTVTGYCGYYNVQENELIDILPDRMYCIRAIAVSSVGSYICLGDYGGHLQIWNYETKRLINEQNIKSACREIECLEFDPTCAYLGCGLTNGKVFILDVPLLTETPNFSVSISNCRMSMCKFSPDSQFLTFADDSFAISLFRLYCVLPARSLLQKKKTKEKPIWDFISKDRRHFLPIVDILYNVPAEKEKKIMLTLSEDRQLVVYNLEECVKEGMAVIKILKLEQTALPTCMSWYPFFEMPSLLAVANTEHKLKIHDLKQKKCLKVNLLPIYDSPIRKKLQEKLLPIGITWRILIVEENKRYNAKDKQKFFVFKTNHHLGFVALPVDGNPSCARALYIHPCGINDVVANPTNSTLFSSGKSDNWVYMWNIEYPILNQLSCKDDQIEQFLKLFSKTDPEKLKIEILTISSALQLQRIESSFPAEIKLENKILIDDLMYILPTLGYYPSKHEFSLFMDDLNFSLMQSKGEIGTTIDIEDFIKLYINHRPVKPITAKDLVKAFKVLSGLEEEDPIVPREHFLKSMRTLGEPIEDEEMLTLVGILRDLSPPSKGIDDLRVSLEIDNTYYEGKTVPEEPEEQLPDEIIDWGELDQGAGAEIEDIVFDDDAPDLSVAESSVEKRDDSKDSSTAKKELEDLLPPRISKQAIICDILGFKLPHKKKKSVGTQR